MSTCSVVFVHFLGAGVNDEGLERRVRHRVAHSGSGTKVGKNTESPGFPGAGKCHRPPLSRQIREFPFFTISGVVGAVVGSPLLHHLYYSEFLLSNQI